MITTTTTRCTNTGTYSCALKAQHGQFVYSCVAEGKTSREAAQHVNDMYFDAIERDSKARAQGRYKGICHG